MSRTCANTSPNGRCKQACLIVSANMQMRSGSGSPGHHSIPILEPKSRESEPCQQIGDADRTMSLQSKDQSSHDPRILECGRNRDVSKHYRRWNRFTHQAVRAARAENVAPRSTRFAVLDEDQSVRLTSLVLDGERICEAASRSAVSTTDSMCGWARAIWHRCGNAEAGPDGSCPLGRLS